MNLKKILEAHKKWLNDEEGGKRADLRDADLSYADLSDADLSYAELNGAELNGADLRYADLSYAELRDTELNGADLSYAELRDTELNGADLSYAELKRADLRDADLSYAELRDTNLSYADLSGANLSYAGLRGANLRNADLSGANLSYAGLSGADLSYADLSGARNVLAQIDFIKNNFETTKDGVIVYKTFNSVYEPPEKWVIQQGSVITENVNFDRTNDCGCGINVAPLKWVKKKDYGKKDIWKCLIRWEWLCGVCVPYNTDGKIRCEKLELIEVVGTQPTYETEVE